MFSKLRRQPEAGLIGALLLSYAVLVLAGALGWVVPFAVAGLAAAAGELTLLRRPTGGVLLEKAGISQLHRHLARDLSVVLLIVTTVRSGPTALVLVLLLPAALLALALGTGVLARLGERGGAVAFVRNIDVARSSGAPRPPAWAVAVEGERLPLLNLLLVPAAVVAVLTDEAAPVVLTAAVTLAVGALVAAVLALSWLRGRGRSVSALPVAQNWLAREQPDLALYFAGPVKDVYQANMWLAPVEATGRRAVVLMRQEEAFRALADTRVPVICVPAGTDFMNLELGSLRAALYVANVGANIHLLREPGVKHVFVGHGDSDKQASVNPYSKVYDEVWVAGPAGRERYALAGVGVLDRDIVEIGRPQLAGVHTFGSAATGRPFTVLYAPTWEGWLEEEVYHTSVVLMGERIVAGLLATPGVRVVYKPHPLTGSRSAKARSANDRIVRRIRDAGGQTDATSLTGDAHLVVTGRTPGLFDCFNQTDLLVSDISSVVSDFMQSQRPYVMANPAGLPEDEFRRRYPTARAAYLLGADCGELAKIVAVTRAGADPMTEARRELKTYLLGPDEPSPMDRFRTEVDRLCG
ncbi:CDP-glycerol glycerophosphotransferase family protein [Micromonospora sp. C31]|uniref:CDP-glycerol glycerophosphotransferase family protein n=1 Tax=Micromonospora sp. C31 TaxID=2824876 RepID=UPI001B38EBBF|nr:CDP-glycerol glycerophosphotransferase family protein [Micromonospora sp. C31]MBQ1075084.1 CDP-glycerol glycerophosphotransferase family protein [Micromonospora sp. C31]